MGYSVPYATLSVIEVSELSRLLTGAHQRRVHLQIVCPVALNQGWVNFSSDTYYSLTP